MTGQPRAEGDPGGLQEEPPPVASCTQVLVILASGTSPAGLTQGRGI